MIDFFFFVFVTFGEMFIKRAQKFSGMDILNFAMRSANFPCEKSSTVR